MSLKAAGAYLRHLRDEYPKTRVDVAVDIGTNESQIVRIENGEIDTRGSLWFGFARAVDASLDDVADLLLNTSATEAQGTYRAQCLIAERKGNPLPDKPKDPNADIKAVVEELNNEQAVILRRILNALFPQFSLPQLSTRLPKSSRKKTSTSGA